MTGEAGRIPAPAAAELPHGFQVQIDRRCFRRGDLRVLSGGSPFRVIRMSDAALAMTSECGRIEVCDAPTRALARKLLDSGIAHPRPMFGPSADDVTVVIPVYDDQDGIDRLLPALAGLTVIVVDDASPHPISVAADGVEVLRLPVNSGPAAARNAGAARAATDFVAFLDADAVPEPGWLMMLLGHFSDPAVAVVAPRIVGERSRPTSPVVRYARACSSLDMGPREAAVAPGGTTAYVPSAAMVVRRCAFGGFDESLRVAEDVDLCWRTHAAGWRIRYEPVARVVHRHREDLRSLLGRHRFYGTGAAELSHRHGLLGAPARFSLSVAAIVVALLTRTPIGLAIALLLSGRIGLKIRRSLGEIPGRTELALRLTGRSVGYGMVQAGSAMFRHYWPVTVLLAVASPAFRRFALRAAIADGAVTWLMLRTAEPGAPLPGPVSYVLLKRCDDAAYGLGLWQGAARRRDLRALRPVVTRG